MALSLAVRVSADHRGLAKAVRGGARGAESWPPTTAAPRCPDQCLLSVGPEGLEPSPARLRAATRHMAYAYAAGCPAAANTLVLWNQLARRELNPRPASYKDAALTAELRASE